MQEQIKYTYKFFKIVIWLLFKVARGHTKKRPNDNFKKFACIFNLLLHQSLYDLTNPIGGNLISVLVLTNPLGRNLISVLVLTNPLGRNLISVLVLTNPLGHNLTSILGLTYSLAALAAD